MQSKIAEPRGCIHNEALNNVQKMPNSVQDADKMLTEMKCNSQNLFPNLARPLRLPHLEGNRVVWVYSKCRKKY